MIFRNLSFLFIVFVLIFTFILNENAYALQYSVPTSVSTGGWASGTFTEINESIRDDSDFITSVELGKNGNDEVEFGFGLLSDPQVNSNHILNYVYKDDNVGTNTPFLTVTLRQGTTDIASWTHNSISTSFVLASQTLSSAQADSITNYSDLQISFNAQCDATCSNAGPSRNSISVSWTEFSVPDAPISVPAQVTGLSATAVSTSQINLSWTAPSDGGSAITGYQIERESPIGGGWSTLVSDTGSTSTSYSDSGLDYGTTYQYRVSAINAIGIGTASSTANDTTFSPTVPAQVTGLSATAVSTSQINLSWTAPSDGGSAITGYHIEQKDGPWSTIVPNTGDILTAYSVTGLAADTTYQYRVSAINAIGTGTVSSIASATTLATATIPDAPTNLQTVPDNQKVILSWDPSFDGGSAIIDYIAEYKLNGDSTWLTFSDGTSTLTTITVTGLTNNQLYNFRVSAVNSIGVSTSSSIVNATPSEQTITNQSTGSDSIRSPPDLLGIGFYNITTENVDNPYSKILVETKTNNNGKFEDYIPYSKHSDTTDVKNYGKFNDYEKRGTYFEMKEKTIVPTIIGKVDQPIQLQIRLEDDFASTKIEHLSLYTDNYGKAPDKKFSALEINVNKGKPVIVQDTNELLKDVQVSFLPEDGILWVNLDLVFQKHMQKSTIILETWHESRIPSYAKIFGALEITDRGETDLDLEPISMTADVEISHDASSPVCKVDNSCFTPFNAKIYEGGIVTWKNTDSTIHTIDSGTAKTGHDNRFNGAVMPGKSFQHTFAITGTYNYYCEMHPWTAGLVSVYEKNGKPPTITFDESKPSLLVTSTSSGGSLMVENNDELFLKNHNMKVIISGHVQEASKSKSIEIIIIKPDKSTEEIHTSTNDRGYYSIPTQLDKKWKEGLYEVIAKYKGNEIGKVSFSVTDTKEMGFGGMLPIFSEQPKIIIGQYVEGTLSEMEFDKKLQLLEFPLDAIKIIKERLEFFSKYYN